MNLIKKGMELGEAFVKEEDGVGVVEIILILVVLIGLVIIFKTNITQVVSNAMKSITDGSGKIIGN